MLSWSISKDPDKARETKALYHAVLEELAQEIERGDGEELPRAVEVEWYGAQLRWGRAEGTAGPCRECGCDQSPYASADEEAAPFAFCPACWRVRGQTRGGDATFDVGPGLSKTVRDLPPGVTMSIGREGERVPLTRPPKPATAEERRAEMDAYAKLALRPVEIGRQVWMGRLAIEFPGDETPDWAGARAWFERAARWGHRDALVALARMALDGRGGPVDLGRAARLLSEAAERGGKGG